LSYNSKNHFGFCVLPHAGVYREVIFMPRYSVFVTYKITIAIEIIQKNLNVINPEWVEFPATCRLISLDSLDTPLLAAGSFI